ncbi:MAG: phage integrase SAM-like domain-containing protein, partial [Alistipes sp.]|nr:phage integrase SAM-like domain-containing protein [Alistipes sp.]
MNNYYYSKDGLTIAAILDSRRLLANGEYPVKIRVTYQRKQVYYPTGKSMSEDVWKSLNVSRRSDIVSERKDIENSFSLVKSAAQELIETGIFTIDMLNVRMSRGHSASLKTAIETKISQLRKEAKIGSADVYASLYRNLKLFTAKDIRYEEVSPMWLKRFEESMRSSGKSQTTIAMNMRSLRSIINEARRSGLVKDALYPFGRGKYEIQEGEGRKLALTLEQIGQIAR